MNIKEAKRLAGVVLLTTGEFAKTYSPQLTGVIIGSIIGDNTDRPLLDKLSTGVGRASLVALGGGIAATVVNRKDVLELVKDED